MKIFNHGWVDALLEVDDLKVINFCKSQIDNSLIVADIKCENCGFVNKVTCKNLSEIHHCVCSNCMTINVESHDGILYKDSKKLMEKSGASANVGVARKGLERIGREYLNYDRKHLVSKDDFPTKESFIRWSIENKYRDWKVVRLNPVTKMLDKGATWTASSYGTRGSNKKSCTAEQSELTVLRAIASSTSDVENKLKNTCKIVEAELKKWPDLEKDGSVREILRELRKIEQMACTLSDKLDEKFE